MGDLDPHDYSPVWTFHPNFLPILSPQTPLVGLDGCDHGCMELGGSAAATNHRKSEITAALAAEPPRQQVKTVLLHPSPSTVEGSAFPASLHRCLRAMRPAWSLFATAFPQESKVRIGSLVKTTHKSHRSRNTGLTGACRLGCG